MARRTTTRPVNSGLGLMFQEEGPGLGPSTGYLKRPGDIFSSEGLMEKIARTRNPSRLEKRSSRTQRSARPSSG